MAGIQYRIWQGCRFVSISGFVAHIFLKEGMPSTFLIGKRGKRVCLFLPIGSGGDNRMQAVKRYAARMGLHYCERCMHTTPRQGDAVRFCCICGNNLRHPSNEGEGVW